MRWALGLLAALALPSCLQNETTVTLNKDGSGTVVEETFLGAKMLEMMTQFAQPGAPDPVAEMFSEDKAKAKIAKMGEGVESTNATYTEGDTITLFDVQVGKMFAQKDELKKIGETSKTDMDAAKAAFAKLDGIKVETKRDVTVTLK